ncbi:hypothetical protein C8Q76DRAFT_690327 [Earliella scabrosa]|nr:hypothetical protein C8Q76DRAFT_690327 [Earliella scabrosa]
MPPPPGPITVPKIQLPIWLVHTAVVIGHLRWIYSFAGPDHRFSLTQILIGAGWGNDRDEHVLSYVGCPLTMFIVGILCKFSISTNSDHRLTVVVKMLREQNVDTSKDLLYMSQPSPDTLTAYASHATEPQLFNMMFHAEDIFESKVHLKRLDPFDLARDDVVMLEVRLVREDVGRGGKWREYTSHFEVHSLSRIFASLQPERMLPDEHSAWGL